MAMAMVFQQAASAAEDVSAQAIQATTLYATQHLFPLRLARVGFDDDRKLGLQTNCNSGYSVAPSSIQVVLPAEFADGKADPVKGVWLVRYRLTRCGESKIYNAVFVAQDGNVPAILPFYPGSTMANYKLVKDAMALALIQAASAVTGKSCPTPHVFDMQVTKAPANRTWDEVWTFNVCGELVDVPMTFAMTEDGRGGSFHSSNATRRATVADVKPQ
jgi:hypothetical protein